MKGKQGLKEQWSAQWTQFLEYVDGGMFIDPNGMRDGWLSKFREMIEGMKKKVEMYGIDLDTGKTENLGIQPIINENSEYNTALSDLLSKLK